jgi:hypothetical protein
MWLSRNKLVFLLAGILLNACQPVILTLPPPPTPEIWHVQFTPALRWLGPIFQQCAAGLPGANLVVNERAAGQLTPTTADFSFQWGERANPAAFTAVIGQDDLVLVVNPANPIGSLTAVDVQNIFDSKIETWGPLLATRCANCTPAFEGALRAYVYPVGDDMRTAASWIPAGPAAVLAPDPAAVRGALAAERFSIGYLPRRWLDASVKAVVIEGANPGQLTRPVLAMAPQEPQGTKRAWLLCVQEKLK